MNRSEVHRICVKFQYKLIIAAIVATFSFSISFAQSPLDFKTVDLKTYNYYMAAEWDSLIEIGNSAIHEEIDYYYLRIRLGISYFNKSNFRRAAIHLEKAMKYNSEDETALQYLYLSYINSKRTADANALVAQFSEPLKQRLNITKLKFINSIYFEGGPILSNNIMKNGNIKLNKGLGVNEEIDFVDDVFYSHFGLRHNITNKISIYHSYSNFNIARQKHITIDFIDTLDNYFTKQNEYYINARIFIARGLSVTPAFHFIKNKFSTINNVYFDFSNFKHVWSDIDTSFNSNIFSLSLSYDYSIFNFGLFGSLSELNNSKQSIGGASVAINPKGNLNLYSFTSLAGMKDEDNGRLIFEQMFGLQCAEKCWLEASTTIGNLANYNEKNAFIVYNIPDKINFKIGTSIIYSLSKNIELSLRYQYISKENALILYQQQGNGNNNKSETTYTNNSIIGGILWKI